MHVIFFTIFKFITGYIILFFFTVGRFIFARAIFSLIKKVYPSYVGIPQSHKKAIYGILLTILALIFVFLLLFMVERFLPHAN